MIRTEQIPEEIQQPELENSYATYDTEDYRVFVLQNRKAFVPKEQQRDYEKVFESKTTLGQRLRSFLKAENDLGRGAKVVKDFALLFAPKWLSVGYNTADDFIFNRILKTMEEDKKNTKHVGKSKTMITFGLLFIMGLLMQTGLLPPDFVELSPDAEWVATASGAVGMILRLITNTGVDFGEAFKSMTSSQS